jgi:predicted DNA-binding protein (UPF0251 family)
MAKQSWDRERVLFALHHAAEADIYMSQKSRRIIANSWPADCSYNYRWLHSLTDTFAPLTDFCDVPPERLRINIFKRVAMRWLDWLDSVDDRRIVWWLACNVSQTAIAKRLGISRQTLKNRYDAALDLIVSKLLETDSDSEE